MNQLARVAPQQSAALASPSNLGDLQTLGNLLAQSGFFADAKQGSQALVKVLAGQELGIPPIAAMTGIYIVQGRVSIGANLMAARVKSSGKYDYRVVEHSADICILEFFQISERGREPLGQSSFSYKDALAAGTKNLDKYPRNMLFARAMSNGVRFYCPDIFIGPVYTPEELDLPVNETGEVVTLRHEQPQPQQPPRLQVAPTATPAATIEAEPLADAEQVAAINALWPEFGVRGAVSGVLKPLAEYLAGKWGVSAPEELSAANAGTLIKWMQQRQLAAQHPEPTKAAPGAGLDAWKCTQESGGRALAMEILSLTAEVETLGIAEAAWRDELKLEFPGVDSRKELTAEQAEAWREILRNLAVALKAKAAAATE